MGFCFSRFPAFRETKADVPCTRTTLMWRVSLSFSTIRIWSTGDQQHVPGELFMVHRSFASGQAPRRRILASSPHHESPHPKGSRSRAPTAASRGGRPAPRTCTCICTTARHSCAPTGAPRDALPSPPPRMYSCSTGSRSCAPTAAPRGARASPPPSTCPRPTHSRSIAPTAAPRGARPVPPPRTLPSSTDIRSCAPTAAPRGARPTPLTCTCNCPSNSRSCAHCITSRCPRYAAYWHVYSSHGQPFTRAHCSTSRCPPSAAPAHVHSFHGQPSARNAFSSSSCPLLAAVWQRRSRPNRRPPRCRRCTALKHPSFTAAASSSSLNRSPVAATVSRIARLTAGSRARSAGSSKHSDLRTCVMTMSSPAAPADVRLRRRVDDE